MGDTSEAQRFPVEKFRAGTTIFPQGEAATKMFVLVDGRLRVESDGVLIAEISEPGSLIGEISVLLDSERGAAVIAETDARLEVIEDIATFFQDPGRALAMARLLAQRLVEMDAKFVELRDPAGAGAESSATSTADTDAEMDTVHRYLKAWRINI